MSPHVYLAEWVMLYGSDVEETEIKIPIYPRSRLVVRNSF